jgi:hypothetical protein
MAKPNKAGKKPAPAPQDKPVPAAEVAEAPKPASQALKRIRYTEDNHHIIEHVHALRFGVNHVPAEIWDRAKEHPTIKAMIEKKLIQPLDDEAVEPGSADA